MKRIALALTFILALLVSTMVGVHFGKAQSGTSGVPTLPSSFFDGFESGNLSQWDGTGVTSGNQLNVQSSIVLSGKYALHAEVPAPCTGLGCAYAYKNVDYLSKGFFAGWVYFTGFADSSTLDRVLKLTGETEGNSISCIGIEDVNGTFEWALHYREGSTENLHIVANGTFLPQFDTWYFIECGGYVSASVGFAECWVNGALIENVTGLDNAPIGLIYQIWAGLALATSTTTNYNANLYLDNVTFSTSYIPFVSLSSPSPAPTPTPLTTPSPTLTPTSTPITQSTPSPTPTVPELQTWIILPLFAVAILLSIVFIGKGIPKK